MITCGNIIEAYRNARQRDQAERALQESEKRFRIMADTAPVMIWMAGPDKLCNYVNEGWLRFVGRTMERELGNGWADGIHPQDSQYCLDTYVTAFEARKEFKMEYRMRRSDGEYRWVLDHGRPRYLADGTFAGYIGTSIDISERRLMEEALKESEDALQMSQRDLRMLAGKLISAQEGERSRLARELHDDLTQRLAVLAIDAGKLEQDIQDYPSIARDRIREIKQQVVRVAEDIHQISRRLHPSILDDLGLVEAIRSECISFSDREGIPVLFEPENVPYSISGPIALCFYRIVQEGLRNIAKHSQSQEAVVALGTKDGGIALSIEDRGRGFTPAEVRGKGTLGLASMEERARLIQGYLSVDSKPGKGTVITVWAPLSGGDA